jgi:hypothetical protein
MREIDAAEILVEFSMTGKPEHRTLWANIPADTRAAMRRTAVTLWAGLRKQHPKAAVWLDGTRIQPSVNELQEHNERVEAVLAREKAKGWPISTSTKEESDNADDRFDDEPGGEAAHREISANGWSGDGRSNGNDGVPV